MNRIKLHIFLVAILASAVFLNTLSNELVWDDKRFVKEWTDIRSFKNIPKFFTGAYAPRHDGKYRPMKGVLLTINYHLWGENVLGYHLQAIAIHVAASLLVYLISLEILRNKTGAFFSATIFATHPIHVEAITFITSSTDILGIIFLLTAFYLYIKKIKHHKLLTLLLALLAYLTNEIALVFLPLLVLYDICFRKLSFISVGKSLKSYLPHLILLVSYLFIRFGLLRITEDTNYMIDQAKITYLIMFDVIAKYLQLLILPLQLNVTYVIRPNVSSFKIDIDPKLHLGSVLDMQMIFSILIVITLIILGVLMLRKKPTVAFSIFWFFVSLIPVSNIVPLPALMTERYAYLASVGFCLFAGILFSKTLTTKQAPFKFIGVALFVLLIGMYSLQAFLRNRDWKNSLTLWSHEVKFAPNSMVVNHNLATAYADSGDFETAIKYFKIADTLNFYHNSQVYDGLGKAYLKIDQSDKAREKFIQSIAANPDDYEAHYFLGQLSEKQQNIDKAISEYKKSIEKNQSFYDGHIALGVTLVKMGKEDEAIEVFKKAIPLSYNNEHAYNNLASIYTKMGEIDLAVQYLKKALEVDPQNVQIKQNLKILENYSP